VLVPSAIGLLLEIPFGLRSGRYGVPELRPGQSR